MTMTRLLWGCVWRGSLLGVTLGASLGAAYGALLLAGAAVVTSVGAALGAWEGSINTWMGAVYLAPYGAIFGAVFGTILGLPLGVLLGVLIAAVTGVCSLRDRGAEQCRRILGPASAATSIALLLGLWVGLGADPSGFVFVENTSGVFDDGPVDLIFVMLLPTLVAGVAGWWIGQRVAAWYAREAAMNDPG